MLLPVLDMARRKTIQYVGFCVINSDCIRKSRMFGIGRQNLINSTQEDYFVILPCNAVAAITGKCPDNFVHVFSTGSNRNPSVCIIVSSSGP